MNDDSPTYFPHEPQRPEQQAIMSYIGGSTVERWAYASNVAKAGDLIPRSLWAKPDAAPFQPSAGKVFLVLEYGAMLGIHPVAALASINVIEGKVAASSAIMSAVLRNAGHKLFIDEVGTVEGGDYQARVTLVRADDPEHPFVSTWSPQRAVRAGLLDAYRREEDGTFKPIATSAKEGKPLPWMLYTENLCKARGISEVARDGGQDAMMGIRYTPEEIPGTAVDASGDVIEGEVIEEPQVPEEGASASGRKPGKRAATGRQGARKPAPATEVPEPAAEPAAPAEEPQAAEPVVVDPANVEPAGEVIVAADEVDPPVVADDPTPPTPKAHPWDGLEFERPFVSAEEMWQYNTHHTEGQTVNQWRAVTKRPFPEWSFQAAVDEGLIEADGSWPAHDEPEQPEPQMAEDWAEREEAETRQRYAEEQERLAREAEEAAAKPEPIVYATPTGISGALQLQEEHNADLDAQGEPWGGEESEPSMALAEPEVDPLDYSARVAAATMMGELHALWSEIEAADAERNPFDQAALTSDLRMEFAVKADALKSAEQA